MSLEDWGEEFFEELGINDYHCLSCGIYFSTDEKTSCPKCGSENIEIL